MDNCEVITMFDGKRLRELRTSMGLTQQQLGDMVNVTKVSICCYEKNNRTPNIETLLDLANALNTNPNYLLGSEAKVSVKEDGEEYNMTVSKDDIEILRELKKHYKLYELLRENPKRMIESIDKKFN